MFFLPSRKILVPPGNSKSPSIINWITTFGILYVVFILEVLNVFKIIVMGVVRFFFAGRSPVLLRTPETQFQNLEKLAYNFEPHYLELDMGGPVKPRMHYVDEGSRTGEVILCLHGEPSWSFLYRKMIPELVREGYRVIAPDLIGFGRSDKFTSVHQYSFELHMNSIKRLLEELNLLNDKSHITLVCQDWGAALGLRVVKDCESSFSRLVIMNASLPTGDITFDDYGDPSKRPSSFVSIVNFAPLLLWKSLMKIVDRNIPVYGLFRLMEGFSSEVAHAYSAPFPHPLYAAGPASFPRLLPTTKDNVIGVYNMETRHFLKTWEKPALLMFGDRDLSTGPYQRLFKNIIKDSTMKNIVGGGHYMLETHAQELTEHIVDFLKK
uniref:Haloalkane dehalogenase n=1 Tax=Caligus rogercresseyi TaxID=217165 RepID=C1BP15_CALRO|nr:Haloalkane dehalogenase [Caligus rogercresseyi]|eukprot:TRINITY_DN7840_c0_g1_i1.p1 TRINITY_DN7840_c0_g1~~TRINITY_DN7840_c0_g1_i1.p1  ORF type:complete len:380 (+),score=95.55 TRINITY_DN7840_c0_g1_i1:106-1245(+)